MNIRHLALVALLLPTMLFAQNLERRWSEKTAFTLEKGKWESGLFQSFRYGLSDKVELRTNALLLPIFPNLGVKVAWAEYGDWQLAGEHSLSYPTLLLKSLSFKGTGGFLSPEFSYPFMLATSHIAYASRWLGDKALLTAEAGFSLTLRGGSIDYRSSIDYPVLYPRMAHYFKGMTLRGGVSYKLGLAERWSLEENARLFGMTRARDNLFVENAGTLQGLVGKSFRIRCGYNMSWGAYPYGNQMQLCPTLDLVFGNTH
jgi:hypothetical protein